MSLIPEIEITKKSLEMNGNTCFKAPMRKQQQNTILKPFTMYAMCISIENEMFEKAKKIVFIRVQTRSIMF